MKKLNRRHRGWRIDMPGLASVCLLAVLTGCSLICDTDDLEGVMRAYSDCEGGKYDSNTGLCWQFPISEEDMWWIEAKYFCEYLIDGERTDWRLPSIEELRALIKGCKATQTGGECGILEDGGTNGNCDGCAPLEGPGISGCYWTFEVDQYCGQQSENRSTFWSSTPDTGGQFNAVDFTTGRLTRCNNTDCKRRISCVHPADSP